MKAICKGVRIFSCAAMLALTGNAFAGPYLFKDLGTLGGRYSHATAINNSGQVVGYSWGHTGNLGERATLWDSSGAHDLGTLAGNSGYSSKATDINNFGEIVGSSYRAGNYSQHATLWTGGNIIDLGTLGGMDSYAYGINDSGYVVGSSQMGDQNAWHAALWRGNTVTDLNPSSVYSQAYDIGSGGKIVGLSYAGFSRAALWDGSGMTDLGTLGGIASVANATNDLGWTVGYSYTPEFQLVATLWADNNIVNLGLLEGVAWGRSEATAINNSGVIVGYSTSNGYSQRATLWNGSTVIDLNSLLDPAIVSAGWELTIATGINENGWIVGNATNNKTWDTHAFLMLPNEVPEPSSLALLFLGAVTFLAARRRKK